MAIIVNNIQISGTASANNYIQGDWIQNDSVTSMNFNYLGIISSTVSGGAPPGWYALESNNNIDYGNNTGWIFTSAITENGDFFLFFDVNTLP
jgi:hypothetical protein